MKFYFETPLLKNYDESFHVKINLRPVSDRTTAHL
jgi:hypothetical protein